MKKRQITFFLFVAFIIYSCSNPISISKKTVLFDSQGGSSVLSQELNVNHLVSNPTLPVKEGFIFIGWYKESTCINIWNFSIDKVTEDLTLYAKWEQAFLITFNSQSGSTVSAISASANTIITEPSSPARSGYIFSGWYKESNCINVWNFNSDKIVGEMILYAKWEQAFLISFNLFGSNSPQLAASDTIANE